MFTEISGLPCNISLPVSNIGIKARQFKNFGRFQRNGSPATITSSINKPTKSSGVQHFPSLSDTDQPASHFHSLKGTAVEAVRLSLSRPFLADINFRLATAHSRE